MLLKKFIFLCFLISRTQTASPNPYGQKLLITFTNNNNQNITFCGFTSVSKRVLPTAAVPDAAPTSVLEYTELNAETNCTIPTSNITSEHNNTFILLNANFSQCSSKNIIDTLIKRKIFAVCLSPFKSGLMKTNSKTNAPSKTLQLSTIFILVYLSVFEYTLDFYKNNSMSRIIVNIKKLNTNIAYFGIAVVILIASATIVCGACLCERTVSTVVAQSRNTDQASCEQAKSTEDLDDKQNKDVGLPKKQHISTEVESDAHDGREPIKVKEDDDLSSETKLDPGVSVNAFVLAIMCISFGLIILFYFIKIIKLVLIFFIAVASFFAFTIQLDLLAELLPESKVRIWNPLFVIFPSQIEPRHFLVIIMSCVFPIFWILTMKNGTYGFIGQDIVGICFATFILRFVHFPSLFLITCGFIFMLFDDVFMTFVTKAFQGESEEPGVMERVSIETNDLPMLLRIPALRQKQDGYECDSSSDNILGFGDIIIPGFLVSFLRVYDTTHAKTAIYVPCVMTAYVIALLCAFKIGFYFEAAQPALLYIIPATLATTFVIAYLRGDFRKLWDGSFTTKPLFSSTVKIKFKKRPLYVCLSMDYPLIVFPYPLPASHYEDKVTHNFLADLLGSK